MDSAYRPLDTSTVVAVARQALDDIEGPAEEIGDGNLNLVFRVRGRSGSVIVKQALPYLRVVGEGWPLTLDRARIEAESTLIHGRCAPGRVPAVLHYARDLAAIVFEDLTEHVVWRQALNEGRHVSGVAEQLGSYVARVLVGTSDLGVDAAEKKALVGRFINPELCAITESLVFTDPFNKDAETNRVDPQAADLVAQLQSDGALHAAAARLRYEFRTRAEALIHGDLHTGSVMVVDDDARVIDAEFAFYGPIGFDVGNVFANLAFARIAHEARGNADFVTIVDDYARLFWSAAEDELSRSWPATEPWRDQFIEGLLVDAAGYAAMEMIRRIVGLAHVTDIDGLPDDLRLQAQAETLRNARLLALGRPVRGFSDLWSRAAHGEAPAR